MSKIAEKIRTDFYQTDIKRDEGLKTPDDILRYDDILYGTDENYQIMDVYRPKHMEGKLPVIVSVHGGAWVYGTKEVYQHYCMSLAERGFAVINYSYRLAPENKFPAALIDTCEVFSFVKDNAERYGFDLNNIFAVGDSAGANILECYCALCTDEDYKNSFTEMMKTDITPKAIAINCGVNLIHVSDDPRDRFTSDLMEDYMKDKHDTKELSQIAALEHFNEAFPPVFIMSAENDFLKSQVAPVIEQMTKHNIPFTARFYKDRDVKLSHVFHLDIRLKAAKLCNDEECAFFKTYLS